MDTQPWDYWEPGGKEPKGRTADVQKRLEGVLAKKPDHPWAIHLYIHLVEASDRPERAEPYADRLAALMPGAGHIVHMPSHIYYRVGRYVDFARVQPSRVQGRRDLHRADRRGRRLSDRLLLAQRAFRAGLGAVARRHRDGARRGRQARQMADQRSRDGHSHRAAGQGGSLFRLGAVCGARQDPGDGRAGRRAALCQGDVALRARCRARREEGCCRRARRSRRHRAASPERPTGRRMDAWAIPALSGSRRRAKAWFSHAPRRPKDDDDAAIAMWRKAADNGGHHPVYGAAVLVLSGQAVARRRASEDGPGRRKPRRSSAPRSSGPAAAPGRSTASKRAAKAKGDAAAQSKAAADLAKAWRGDPALLSLDRL